MTKLNQLIAVRKGAVGNAQATITSLYQKLQKQALLSGISRTYKPRDDEGESLPPESTRVQVTATEALGDVRAAFIRAIDLTATVDNTNRVATGTISINGKVLAADIPVSTLLYLEKQLTDLRTVIDKLPVLDPAEDWTYSDTAACWTSAPVQTTRTKKVPRNHVKAEATDRHPAQVEMYTEDVIVGTWTTVKFSGAVPAATVRAMVARVDQLRDAVKMAREAANAADVVDTSIGESLLDFVLDG